MFVKGSLTHVEPLQGEIQWCLESVWPTVSCEFKLSSNVMLFSTEKADNELQREATCPQQLRDAERNKVLPEKNSKLGRHDGFNKIPDLESHEI